MSDITDELKQHVLDSFGQPVEPEVEPQYDPDHPYEAKWRDGFTENDPSNPSHIFLHDRCLCGHVEDPDRIAATELFAVTREFLLHPESTTGTDERFCKVCVARFRDIYDFKFTMAELECPECGSFRKAIHDLETGVTSCKGCGWNRNDNRPKKRVRR